MSKVYEEFGVDVLRDSENAGPTAAEVRMAQEIERLRAALRFYAEPYKYTDIHGDDVQVPDFYSETDFGETARLALKGKL
jgi:hypothetical protein